MSYLIRKKWWHAIHLMKKKGVNSFHLEWNHLNTLLNTSKSIPPIQASSGLETEPKPPHSVTLIACHASPPQTSLPSTRSKPNQTTCLLSPNPQTVPNQNYMLGGYGCQPASWGSNESWTDRDFPGNDNHSVIVFWFDHKYFSLIQTWLNHSQGKTKLNQTIF